MANESDSNWLFEQAVALREKGKHKEAADIFLGLATGADRPLDKAGMLLNVAHASKEMGQFDLARSHLEATRDLLRLPSGITLSNVDEENRRGLVIGVELEDARIFAGEHELQAAIDKLDLLLAKHRSDLLKPNFADINQTVQRDRAFVLADLGRFKEALSVLDELYSTDPHERWILFYLGYCYLCTGKYVDAQLKLVEAIQSGLPEEFEGRAHCMLGAACYELRDFARAKLELQKGVETASLKFIKEAGIWSRLRDACLSLGLRAEAERYASLASKPS